jgi:hypothetical protein
MSTGKVTKIIHRQRPVKGGRSPLPACVLKDIYDAVDRRARKFGVSRSFVIAVALAEVFGITEQETYVTPDTKHWRRPVLSVGTDRPRSMAANSAAH